MDDTPLLGSFAWVVRRAVIGRFESLAASHGLTATHEGLFNADLLAVLKS